MTKAERTTKIVLALFISLVMMIAIGEGIFGARLIATADEDDPTAVTEENGEAEENGETEENGEPEEPEESESVFEDVSTDDWFYDAVMYVYDNELVIGFEDGTFRPSGTLTRAQIVVMLYREAGQPDVAGLENPFSDVVGHWALDEILWAADAGIVEGHDDGTFTPGNPVTKIQLAAIISRAQQAFGLIPPDIIQDFEWPDFDDIPEWGQGYITALTAQGVFQDIPGDDFGARDYATRDEVASMLYNWLSAAEEAPGEETPEDLEEGAEEEEEPEEG